VFATVGVMLEVINKSPVIVPPAFGTALFAVMNAEFACTKAPLANDAAELAVTKAPLANAAAVLATPKAPLAKLAAEFATPKAPLANEAAELAVKKAAEAFVVLVLA
jgi:hypothetical protein